MNECWILSIHSSRFSTLLCVVGASLEGTAAMDFFTIWQPILGLAKGRRQKKECEVGIYISSTPFLAGHCKLVVSFYQRPKLLVVSLLLQLPSESFRKRPLLFPLLAQGGEQLPAVAGPRVLLSLLIPLAPIHLLYMTLLLNSPQLPSMSIPSDSCRSSGQYRRCAFVCVFVQQMVDIFSAPTHYRRKLEVHTLKFVCLRNAEEFGIVRIEF